MQSDKLSFARLKLRALVLRQSANLSANEREAQSCQQADISESQRCETELPLPERQHSLEENSSDLARRKLRALVPKESVDQNASFSTKSKRLETQASSVETLPKDCPESARKKLRELVGREYGNQDSSMKLEVFPTHQSGYELPSDDWESSQSYQSDSHHTVEPQAPCQSENFDSSDKWKVPDKISPENQSQMFEFGSLVTTGSYLSDAFSTAANFFPYRPFEADSGSEPDREHGGEAEEMDLATDSEDEELKSLSEQPPESDRWKPKVTDQHIVNNLGTESSLKSNVEQTVDSKEEEPSTHSGYRQYAPSSYQENCKSISEKEENQAFLSSNFHEGCVVDKKIAQPSLQPGEQNNAADKRQSPLPYGYYYSSSRWKTLSPNKLSDYQHTPDNNEVVSLQSSSQHSSGNKKTLTSEQWSEKNEMHASSHQHSSESLNIIPLPEVSEVGTSNEEELKPSHQVSHAIAHESWKTQPPHKLSNDQCLEKKEIKERSSSTWSVLSSHQTLNEFASIQGKDPSKVSHSQAPNSWKAHDRHSPVQKNVHSSLQSSNHGAYVSSSTQPPLQPTAIDTSDRFEPQSSKLETVPVGFPNYSLNEIPLPPAQHCVGSLSKSEIQIEKSKDNSSYEKPKFSHHLGQSRRTRKKEYSGDAPYDPAKPGSDSDSDTEETGKIIAGDQPYDPTMPCSDSDSDAGCTGMEECMDLASEPEDDRHTPSSEPPLQPPHHSEERPGFIVPAKLALMTMGSKYERMVAELPDITKPPPQFKTYGEHRMAAGLVRPPSCFGVRPEHSMTSNLRDSVPRTQFRPRQEGLLGPRPGARPLLARPLPPIKAKQERPGHFCPPPQLKPHHEQVEDSRPETMHTKLQPKPRHERVADAKSETMQTKLQSKPHHERVADAKSETMQTKLQSKPHHERVAGVKSITMQPKPHHAQVAGEKSKTMPPKLHHEQVADVKSETMRNKLQPKPRHERVADVKPETMQTKPQFKAHDECKEETKSVLICTPPDIKAGNEHSFQSKEDQEKKTQKDKTVHSNTQLNKERTSCIPHVPHSSTSRRTKTKSKPKNDLPYVCTECRQIFKEREQLLQHLYDHLAECTGNNPFVCPKCPGRRFSDMKQHERHHRMGLECDICREAYHSAVLVAEHKMRVHAHKKTYSCKMCSKSYSLPEELTRHEKRHSKSTLVGCKECGKKFQNKEKLSSHMQAHSGKHSSSSSKHHHSSREKDAVKKPAEQKPNSCSKCGVDISISEKSNEPSNADQDQNSQYSKLNTAMSTDFKCCKCDECGAGFCEKHALRDHTSRHRKGRSYKCGHCNHSLSLSSHMKKYHKENIYECKCCNKWFMKEEELKFHESKEHINGLVNLKEEDSPILNEH